MGSNNDALRRMLKLVNSFFSRSDCIPFREPVDWRALELWDYPQIIKKMMDLGTVKRKLERGQYQTAAECADDIRLIWTNCMTYNADGSDFFLLAESFSRRFEDRYKKIRQEFDTGENYGKTGYSSSSSGKDGRKHSGSGGTTGSGSGTGSGGGGGGGGSGGSTSSQIEPPSLEAKTKFGSNLFRLTGVQLGHVLQVLDLRCPRALERPTSILDVNDGNKGGGSWNDGGSQNNGSTTTPNSSSSSSSSAVVGGEEIEINIDALDLRTFYELDSYVKERISKSRRKNSHSSLGGEKDGSFFGTSNRSQYGSNTLADLSPPNFMGGNTNNNTVGGDSDMDHGSSSYSNSGGKSSSSKKMGKRKR